jgi:hypothetical protein
MSVVSPIPTETDLAISPELAILAALRISIELAGETLRAVHPVDERPLHCRDADILCAATIVHLAEALRLAIVDYEQRMAGLRESL